MLATNKVCQNCINGSVEVRSCGRDPKAFVDAHWEQIHGAGEKDAFSAFCQGIQAVLEPSDGAASQAALQDRW